MPVDMPWAYFVLTSGVRFVGMVMLGLIAVRVLSALGEPAGDGARAAEEGDLDRASPMWQWVADGLQLYRSALTWRVFLSVLAYVLLMLGMRSQSPGFTKLVAVAFPIAVMFTTAAMITGVVRYARQPMNSNACGSASLAAVLMGLGLLLDGYGLVLTFKLFSLSNTEWPSYRELHSLTEQMQSISMWAMGLGFSSLLAMLISFGQLTNLLDRLDLRNRVVGISLFICFASVTVLGFRSYLGSRPHMEPGTLLVYAIACLMVAIAALATYLGLVMALVESIRRDGDSDLPPARLL